ncbi:MAG: glycoside hydrolase family 3 N-terminal domain-containing protein [Acidobacteriota bacterium]
MRRERPARVVAQTFNDPRETRARRLGRLVSALTLLTLLGLLAAAPSEAAPSPQAASAEQGSSGASSPPPYRDASLNVDLRVADLLGRMTLEEKVAQMLCLWRDKNLLLDEDGNFDAAKAAEVMPLGAGQIARPSDMWQRGIPGVTPGRTPRDTVRLVNAIQRFAVEKTRLGIPVLFHEEGLHGFQAPGGTVFPQAIALASTWDPELVEEVYTVVAREIRSRGSRLALTPVVDVARDARWGRIEETYGEDPFLVSEMGLASVRGFQGADFRGGLQGAATEPLGEDRVMATLKHMTGHGQPESGTNVGPASISERTLRNFFFPPFERAVREAGAMAVMASYNEIDGVPSHANRWLLGEVLRGEWDFDGFVVADYYAIGELRDRHAVADSLEAAARLAVAAGVDIELPNPKAYPTLTEQVRSGAVPEEQIDRSVKRLLRGKFLAGLFEDPYADAELAESLVDDPAARKINERAAEQAVTLLKNEGDLLPLDAKSLRRVAVIGPNAAETILGGYTDKPTRTVSLLEGVERFLEGTEVEVVHAQGVHITETRNWFGDDVVLWDRDENLRLIEEAVEVARAADVVVLAIGDNEETSREAWAENHLGDRTSLQLVGEQNELFQAIAATGVPTVVVMIHGRPLAITEIKERAPAILDAWYLGQETGTALARVLFGEVNPGGRLPVSVPRSAGHLPVFYNYKPTARRGYLFDTTEPLWPFGFGLSYTSFSYGAPTLEDATIAPDGSTQLSVPVTNTGSVTGDEVVQLYIRDVFSSVTRPVRELRAFERIRLEPGESRTVSFRIGPEELEMWDLAKKRRVEPGEFLLSVGPSSAPEDLKGREVTLTVASAP